MIILHCQICIADVTLSEAKAAAELAGKLYEPLCVSCAKRMAADKSAEVSEIESIEFDGDYATCCCCNTRLPIGDLIIGSDGEVYCSEHSEGAIPTPTPWPADRLGECIGYSVQTSPGKVIGPMPYRKAIALGGVIFAIVRHETEEWEGGWRDTEGPNATGCWEGGEQLFEYRTYRWEDWGENEWNWSEDPIETEREWE
jgi:hypothetical protein